MRRHLRQFRERRDLTQTELGALVGLQPATISLIESGHRSVSAQVLLLLCDALALSADESLALLRDLSQPRRVRVKRVPTAVAPSIIAEDAA